MIGSLYVFDSKPHVLTEDGIFPANKVSLTKHTNGSWNFNVPIKGLCFDYKEHQKVSGILIKNQFVIFETLK